MWSSRALVARRLDIGCLFTFETEHPDVLAPLARCPRTAWGYGPADYVGAIHAVRRRLLPFGIVLGLLSWPDTPDPLPLAALFVVAYAIALAAGAMRLRRNLTTAR